MPTTKNNSSHQIRQTFVDYFKRQGHTIVPSSSLIPENDPTLLFANAGMNQFKNTFVGIEKRDYSRAVSVQKVVRAGGKHNDLENVGFTARHHTFFEMLGNFSFGDYFKKDAIHFAWELLTKDYGIPKEKLYVTVFETDDEAADIWHKQEGIPRDRIFRLGEKDNFWRMGDTGPCGPCTEIFYDHGPKAGKESDPFKGIVGGEDRFVEIWNLVFMQFYEKSPGVMDPLPKPSVDTGSGLERVVAALQGKFNNYDTDLFSPMIEKACKISGADYVTDLDILKKNPAVAEKTAALRVLADHCRATGFLIADGALPSNEGRGYVLRRILRRAIRFGHKLNSEKSLLPGMVESLIQHMDDVYPELQQRRELIISTVKDEESRFLTTLDQGTQILNEELKKVQSKGQKVVSGEVVFKLYDTYGFPADLTRVIANEQGLTIDEKNFDEQMEEARTKAKASWRGQSLAADESHLIQLTQKIKQASGSTKFVGYEHLSNKGKVLALSNGQKEVSVLNSGEKGFVILDETSFYAEGGGQVGDLGHMVLGPLSTQTQDISVFNTTQQNSVYLHHIQVNKASLKIGDVVTAQVENRDRRNTMANHSATHLMHAALRQVLGTHVGQAGSVVDPARLRFDFTHNKAMKAEEIAKVEELVNEQIALGIKVESETMSHKNALESGAMALFGEKYGDQVRVLRMGNFSCELCGGTHVNNTSQIRVFKIVSETGVSSGVRRIEALTGEVGIRYLMAGAQEALEARKTVGLPASSLDILSSQGQELSQYIEQKREEIRTLEKEIRKIQGSKINIDELASKASSFKSKTGVSGKLVTVALDLDDREVLAQVTDHLKNKIQSGVVVVVGRGEQSRPIIVSVSKNLSAEHKAGDLLKEIAGIMGGKGGGRPDFAQGAAPQREKLQEAFDKIQLQFKN